MIKIAVSIGDINGVGLECFAKSLNSLQPDVNSVQFILFGPIATIKDYFDSLNIEYSSSKNSIIINRFVVDIVPTETNADVEFGLVSELSGKLAAESIFSAVQYIKDGKADILLTLPINKKSISLSGFEFPGHTEMLGESFGTDPLMILFSNSVRVALVTVHVPVSKVSSLLRPRLIESKFASFEKSLREDFGIKNPRIAILGLNPHAGEQGNIGIEELSYINDTVDKLNMNYNSSIVEGPFPADGFFGFGQYKNYDGILAMYHDQGLIPLKLLANGGGVNFTANLSIIRVSPDHGTAFPLAGKNMADPQSTLEAIQSGINLSLNRINLL